MRYALAVAALTLSLAGPTLAQTPAPLPAAPAVLLTDAIDRPGQDLSGLWAYSTDLYRTAETDINGRPPAPRAMRFRDISVDAEVAKKPDVDFFEFDMDKAPKAALPGAWNAAEPELRWFDGLMWYQRHFTAESLGNRRAFLRFEAVNYRVKVFVNGQLAGQHEGGFTPFSIEVGKLLRAGDNQITIGVDSTHDATTVPPTVTDWDLYGGVTRPIRLIYTPETFIDDEFLHLDLDGHIRGSVHLNGTSAGNRDVSVRIGAHKAIALKTDGNGDAKIDVAAPKGLKLWSPESPTLYDVTFAAGDDHLTDKVGFRTIQAKGTDILLNGKPVFLRGISMHEEEFGSNPGRRMTPQAIRALLTEVKDGLHGNFVRLAHYPHSELTTRMADEMGLMIWSEIPVYWSVDFGNEKTLLTARRMLAENILRDRNRASIIVWSVGNETPNTPERNRFLTTLADDARARDGTRMISAALLLSHSMKDGHIEIAIDDPLVEHLDLMAANTYSGWYGDDRLSDLKTATWAMPAGKPMIFSEFGADALAGLHDTTKLMKFTEEYQAEYYRQTLAMADRIPALRGMSPWILKDFQSPRRQHPIYQNGWNRKGLISETGVRKEAFDVLANYYIGKEKD